MLIPSKTRYHGRPSSADWRGVQMEQAITPPDLHADLPRRDDAPATARALATAWCVSLDLQPMLCDNVRLLVSEVVTNAVVHSEAPDGANVRLAASLSEGNVLVTVSDCG